ncbi:hypothetical protein QFC20_005080 [Naganishia adeliensis]|uniref:Uncharacterized protein n=1 Tax=Naganishia adeliensis TaxID=92952 RepID=A0ACC2VTW5_9TREE|nr:hypothetical protein QFC20_005080 [Naganishia adeliensis]
MPSITPPTTILRLAKEEELETIATLHATALDDDPISDLLFVDPFVNRKSDWIKGAKEEFERGDDTIWVLECTVTGQIIGEAWVRTYDKDNQPEPRSDQVPEGFKKEEYAKIFGTLNPLSQELMDKYGKFMYLREFAILPGYQQQGLGERLLLHVIELAKKEKLNIALTANAGKSPFYEKFGFREMGAPIMLGPDNNINGGASMLCELFPAGI